MPTWLLYGIFSEMASISSRIASYGTISYLEEEGKRKESPGEYLQAMMKFRKSFELCNRFLQEHPEEEGATQVNSSFVQALMVYTGKLRVRSFESLEV